MGAIHDHDLTKVVAGRGLKYSSIVQFYGRGLFIKTSVRYAEGKRPRRSSPRRLVWLDRYPTRGVAAAAVIV